MRTLTLLLSIAALSACGSKSDSLRIDLRTDILPFLEMTRVTSELRQDGAMLFSRDHTVQASNYVEGVRIADFDDLPSGEYELTVIARGDVMQTQRVLVRVRGETAATVLMTRDCRGVTCDDPAAPTCLNGTCVPDTCTGETLPECGAPMCSESSCGTLAACASASCASGACLAVPDDSRCAPDQLCDPTNGCVARPVDGGMDAGLPDTSIDTSSDAGPGSVVRAEQVVVSRWATCSRLGTEVTCWGNNLNGEIGVEMAGAYGPTRVDVEADEIAASSFAMCARRGGVVRCWGDNAQGELGQGDTTARRGEIVEVPLVDPAIELYAIGSGFCALDSMRRYSCWGSNTFQQLISWMDVPQVAPILGMQERITDVAGGDDHLCVLKDQQVFCVGRGLSGEIGDGAMANTNMLQFGGVPELVTQIAAIRPPRDAARSTTCALGTDTQVYCWGFDDSGQIGSGGGVGEFAPLPAQTLGLIGVTELYDTMRPMFARLSDGSVRGWGSRANGLYGDRDTEGWEESPVETTLGRFDQLAFGITHACGIQGNEVWCWGRNDTGTLPGVDGEGEVVEPYPITF